MHLCVDFHAGPSKEYLIFFLFFFNNLSFVVTFSGTKVKACLLKVLFIDRQSGIVSEK